MITIAHLLHQSARRPSAKEFLKAMMLAVAFLFWAANQLWPDLPQATPFNDIAIALFVLDVFLVIIGWPTTSPDESFAETYIEKPQEKSKARAASPTRNELALRAAEGRQRSALSNRPEKSPHQFNRPA